MDTLVLKHKEDLENELKRVLDILIFQYKPSKIIIFGSLANNKINMESDIDLFIVKNTDKRYWERIDEVLHLIHPQEAMDIFVLTPQEVEENFKKDNLYLKEILERGRVVYERPG